MYEQVEKPKENKSRAVANSPMQKKNNGKMGVIYDNRDNFQFVDNRETPIKQPLTRQMKVNDTSQLQRTDMSNREAPNQSAGTQKTTQLALGTIKNAAFIARNASYKTKATWAARLANSWDEATRILELAKVYTNEVDLGTFYAILGVPQLLTVAGNNNIALLPSMVTRIGGGAQVASLIAAISYKHTGHADLANDLINEAAGSGATFARLAAELPYYRKAGAPGGTPPGVTAAMWAYNVALGAAPLAAYTQIGNEALAAYNAANNLSGIMVGINAGLLNNILNGANRTTALQASAGAHALAGTAPTAPEIGHANALRGMIYTTLNNQVTAAVGGVVGPAAAADLALFNTARTNIDNANNGLVAANAAPTIVSVSWDHFLTRHTAHYFNFGEIKADNTLWNVGWGAGAAMQVEAQINGLIGALGAAGNWLNPGVPLPNQAVAAGTAQIAGLATGPNTLNVGQFFPENNPGANIYDHPASTMRAIEILI